MGRSCGTSTWTQAHLFHGFPLATNEQYLQKLIETNPLREPLLRRVIQALDLPPGSCGLDAGCGGGLQAILLAEAIGPDGHVIGLDISPGLLAYANQQVEEQGLSERIGFKEGDVNHLPFEADSFDWVWSADCIGYPVGELLPVLQELKRALKPGGLAAILAWSSQSFLPGYPLLEARLNATCSTYAPYLQGTEPQAHFMRAVEWFSAAGYEKVHGRTFVGDVQGPLSDEMKAAVISLFEMLWGDSVPDVDPGDRSEYLRLCSPDSPDFILNLPDYYGYFTYTVFRGTVPKR